jgi:hypothetical protein
MKVFHQMAAMASSQLLGASAEHRISNGDLAKYMEEMALGDAELAEHYVRLADALPALQAQRAAEDVELASASGSPSPQPWAA